MPEGIIQVSEKKSSNCGKLLKTWRKVERIVNSIVGKTIKVYKPSKLTKK
jgi:ribosomal protein S19